MCSSFTCNISIWRINLDLVSQHGLRILICFVRKLDALHACIFKWFGSWGLKWLMEIWIGIAGLDTLDLWFPWSLDRFDPWNIFKWWGFHCFHACFRFKLPLGCIVQHPLVLAWPAWDVWGPTFIPGSAVVLGASGVVFQCMLLAVFSGAPLGWWSSNCWIC